MWRRRETNNGERAAPTIRMMTERKYPSIAGAGGGRLSEKLKRERRGQAA